MKWSESHSPVLIRVHQTSLRRLLSLNLRLRFTRALSSLRFRLLAASTLAGLIFPGSTPAETTLLDAGVMPTSLMSPVSGQAYELNLHHLHTGEDLHVVYRIGNTYIPSALEKLNHFLRDHRTADASHYDPKEFDLLHNVLTRLGRPQGTIDVVCGYRTPWSNNYLRTRSSSTGVARNSQHMLAKAIDIRIPGIQTRKLRDIALSLGAGGVGYYPVSRFVHVDVGPVRHWSFAGRGDD